jgi:hypothetical protein
MDKQQMEGGNGEDITADQQYEAALAQFGLVLRQSINTSQQTKGYQADQRRFWASVLFTRLCLTATSVVRLCPGSPADVDVSHWDFTSIACLVRSLFQAAVMLFYLATENVSEDESRARILLMKLRDCTERLRMFTESGSSEDQAADFKASRNMLRDELVKNSHFVSLPIQVRDALLEGATDTMLTQEDLLGRMGQFDQDAIVWLRLLSAHADLSPLAYYRTGENSRGTGDENETDKFYIAEALTFASKILVRATGGVSALFRDLWARGEPTPTDSKPEDLTERVSRQVIQWEGGVLEAFRAGPDWSAAMLLCSNCFHDEGLRLNAIRLGFSALSRCPQCGSKEGKKLPKQGIEMLAHQFFVWGTVRRSEYGGYPAVQFNQHQPTSVKFTPWLEHDVRLFETTLQVGFFEYGPRYWMFGEIEPLKALQDSSERPRIVSRLLNEYPERLLTTDECFYRIRKAPALPQELGEYDSPPREFLGAGRFDSTALPILYGSQDMEVCLHECRITAEDEIYLATLTPTRTLRLLNLAEPLLEEGVTEFESLDIAVHMLFLAGRHSYEISRDFARAAQKAGFDGLVYPSYFTLLRTGEMPFATTYGMSHRRFPQLLEHTRRSTISNVALFGRPVADRSVAVRSINRVVLNRVEYNVRFGPVLQ